MKALITGIDGQDGTYLSELLLKKGYEVHGMIRRVASPLYNSQFIPPAVLLHYGDMETENHLCKLIHDLQPDEVYNLAGQSDVGISFQIPEYTGSVTGIGVTRLLEAVRAFSPHSKVYQASSSEMFGNAPAPQNELTPLRARSPYAAAKIYAHNMAISYREAHNMFVCNGILFNHESPRRGLQFVTRKISNTVARILLKKTDRLQLGNINARRDWGYSPEYVNAMWMMLQQPAADDYVIGTGETHTVQEFVEVAFTIVGLDWREYTDADTGQFMRPGDVNYLQADATKARTVLGWEPTVKFYKLVNIMVEHDLNMEGK